MLRLCLKVGIAVGLAYVLTYGEKATYALYAVLTASLVVGENIGDDLNQSFVRLVGTLIGAFVGVVFLIAMGVDVWAVIACAVVAQFLSRLVKLEQLSRATLAVCMVTLLLHPDRVASYGAFRVANTLIGAAIGLAVSLLVWPVRAEAAATKAVVRLLDLSAEVLIATAQPENPTSDDTSDETVQQLAKVFKAIRDARREGWVFHTTPTATVERAILCGQVGLGAVAVALGCERLRKNADAGPFITAVATVAARLAERAKSLAHPPEGGFKASPTPEPISDFPTPPAEADLNATEGVLMAGVIGELRVISSALAVLERVAVETTTAEKADRIEDAKNG
jgi:gas vesicle protein